MRLTYLRSRHKPDEKSSQAIHETLYHPLVLISYLQMKRCRETDNKTNVARGRRKVYKIWGDHMQSERSYYAQRTNMGVRVIAMQGQC